MDNKEAIEILKELPERIAAVIMPSDRFFDYKAALDLAIKTLEADRWIPVSERLPNTLGVYNVTRKMIEGETIYFISSASYFDGQNTWYHDTGINHGRPYLTDIIAWRPLPEAYKESEPKECEGCKTPLCDGCKNERLRP